MADYEVSRVIDVRGEVCPVPDVETKRAIKGAKDSEILKVLVDYPLSVERIPESVKKLGSEILEVKKNGGSDWEIYVKVKKQ